MSVLKSMLQDGIDGSWSSKRTITFLAFLLLATGFVAEMFFEKNVNPTTYEYMIGLGVTASEKFAPRIPSSDK